MQQDDDLKCLDKLIAGLGGTDTGAHSAGPNGLLLEHLEAARRDILGSMPREYRASLQYAKESIGCIANKSDRARTKTVLQTLLDFIPKLQRPVSTVSGMNDAISSSDRARSSFVRAVRNPSRA